VATDEFRGIVHRISEVRKSTQSTKNGKWLPILQSAGKHQLCLLLLPFTHARSESIYADSLNSNFLQLGRRSGGRPQQAVHPMRLPVNTVIHTTLVGLDWLIEQGLTSPPTQYRLYERWFFTVGLEPATFRSLVGWLLVRRPTSSATYSLKVLN